MERYNYNNLAKFIWKHFRHHFKDNQPTNNYHDYETDNNQSRVGYHWS